MRHPEKKFTPQFRSFAAMMLLVWVMAQALCFTHCNFGWGHGEPSESAAIAKQKSCCAAESGESSKNNLPSATSACLTFKSIVLQDGAVALTAPDTLAFCLAAPLIFASEGNAATNSLLYQHKSDFHLPAQGVSFDPALRSIPPPVS